MAPEDAPADIAYLEGLLREHGDLGPRPERVSEAYADERIREKLARLEGDRPKAGLWSVNARLKEHDVPAEVRLHLVTAVAHLGRLADDSRGARLERAR